MACIRCYVFFSLKYLGFHWKFQYEGVGLCERVFPYISYIRYISNRAIYEVEKDFVHSGTRVG